MLSCLAAVPRLLRYSGSIRVLVSAAELHKDYDLFDLHTIFPGVSSQEALLKTDHADLCFSFLVFFHRVLSHLSNGRVYSTLLRTRFGSD